MRQGPHRNHRSPGARIAGSGADQGGKAGAGGIKSAGGLVGGPHAGGRVQQKDRVIRLAAIASGQRFGQSHYNGHYHQDLQGQQQAGWRPTQGSAWPGRAFQDSPQNDAGKMDLPPPAHMQDKDENGQATQKQPAGGQ